MTDKLLIDRELLERELLSVLDFSESNLRRVVDHLIDVGYTRAAPRQPEGEGLEVVAWQDADNPLYTTAERRQMHGWATDGYPVVELCRLPDAQRAIAELREEISDLHTTMMAAAVEIQEHWQAHCDEEGYGPANLMNRLERGIAAQYGYTAQTVVQIEAERDTLRQQLAEVGELVEALRAADEYLSSNRFNEIGSGSILHRQMQAALAKWEGKA